MYLFSTFLGTLLIGTILSAPAAQNDKNNNNNNNDKYIGNKSYRHRRASSSTPGAGTSLLRKRPSSATNLRSAHGNVNSLYPSPNGVPTLVAGNATSLHASGYIEPSVANPNYWIADRYHSNIVCLLAAFSGTVRVRPANSSFRGDTFHISPEVSLGRRANCERHSKHMFWKFSQHDERILEPETDDDDDGGYDSAEKNGADDMSGDGTQNSINSSSLPATTTLRTTVFRRPAAQMPKWTPFELSNRQLSVGFHIVGPVLEFHVAYIECLQQAERNEQTQRFRFHSDPYCVNLSVSFDLGSFSDRAGFECTYIWGKTLKDVRYTRDRRYYAGEAQISLEFVQIDRDPIPAPGLGGYAFRKNRRYCLADTLLSWQSLAITGSLFTVFLIGFFGLCVCSNSSCSDDLSPGSYSSDYGCCSCCCDSSGGRTSCCSFLSRILCFCFNRRRQLSTRRGHGRRGELLNRSTYERDLLDRSNQSDHHNHVTKLDGHQCHAHHHHNHSTIGGHHQRHYRSNSSHRHIRRPAPPPLLPPPPPPPSSSSTGTTHVDSELLVLPVGQTSDCQVLLELLIDHDNETDNIIEFDDNCECIDNNLIIVQSDPPKTSTPLSCYDNCQHAAETIIITERPPSAALLNYFCACFMLCVAIVRHAQHYPITVQYHHRCSSLPKAIAKPDPDRSDRFALSSSKYRSHNGSNDHVRGLN